MPYIGATPLSKVDTQNRVTYVAAAGQTSFVAAYTPGYVDVYVNGIKLQGPSGADFTATDSANVVLTMPCVAGDIVEIVAIKASSPYDHYTKAQTDALLNSYFAVAGGTSDALTVTTSPLVAALADGVELRVRTASSNATITPTITVSNLGLTKNITVVGGAALPIGAWAPGQELTLRFNNSGNRFELLQARYVREIQSILATVGSNALTFVLNPTSLDFRSPTLGNGVPNSRFVQSAISLTIPSTATLGTVSGVLSRIVLLAIDNAGAVELAVVNIAGGVNLDETTLISTTAISTGSTSAGVIYSTTARTNVPFRVIGYADSTQATAGTWATAPSTVQGFGGNAMGSMGAIGYSQTWQNVLGSRAINTTYYNTTGKPIQICAVGTTAGTTYTLTINGVAACVNYPSASASAPLVAIIPPEASYSVGPSGAISTWSELR